MVDINQLFPITESVGIQVNLAFSNTVLTNSQGTEQRIVRWQDPIRSFNFARKILKGTEVTTIGNFYDLAKGANYSFLYQDKSDYLSNGQGYLYPNPDGTRVSFQVVKQYQIGTNIHYRAITQINTLSGIKQGTTTLTNWTLGNNGQVTFSSAPSSGNALTASFNFYVPVTFENDEFTYKLASRNLFQVDKLLLKELKTKPYLYPVDVVGDLTSNDFPIELDYLAQNQGFQTYDTEIITLSSGYRERTSRILVPYFKQLLGQRQTFNQSQIDTLLNFWLANKANGCIFSYVDSGLTNQTIPARFNRQELTYSLNSNSSVYSLNPLELKLYRSGLPTKDDPMTTPTDLLSYPLMTLARICNITVPTATPQVFSFTTADRDLTIAGVTYAAGSAFEPTALQQSADLNVDNQEIKTIISSNEITESMLTSGIFDDAIITVATVNYLNLPSTLDGAIVEQKGIVGEITSSDTQFTMENLTQATSLLKQSVSVKTSPMCRYNLGDSRCTVDLSAHIWYVTIVQTIYGNTTRYFRVDHTNIPDSILAYGKCFFTDGENANLEYMIFNNNLDASTGTTVITLNTPALFDVGTSDLILTAGCDKQWQTCSQLYNNGINYGGERSGGNFMPSNNFYYTSPKVSV